MTGNYNEGKNKGEICHNGEIEGTLTYELSSIKGSFPTDSNCATSITHIFKNKWVKSVRVFPNSSKSQ